MIATTPTGRAIIQAAAERRVGSPVYLRYAAEVRDTGDLIRQAAGAVAFAARALGEPSEIYAVGVPRSDDPTGAPAYLSLTVRHPDGVVALLGIGREARPGGGTTDGTTPAALSPHVGHAQPVSPSVLLLGDRGVAERYPGPGGDAWPIAGATTAGDAASQADAEELVRYAAAVRRSLASGTVEGVGVGNGG